ncbi:hypothetical protein LIER_21630 [Lithospermum erythrorhizon]|uniref:Reverse transcriptase Ty1/copia-type domain-containing protein n=1 Tax=Lithospermum erythrorhizon TaxID=34254 RepID=A0AAV3QTD4_LITER
MDVKSAFLNGMAEKEVYVEQPKGFVDSSCPQHVYRLKKALYGPKQAPRAWYKRLTKYLLTKGYAGGTDKTLFIKYENFNLMVAQIYVDDIIFGGMSEQQFVQHMESEFEMSMIGELNYFLGFQVKQMTESVFISQSNYVKNLVKKFGFENAKSKRTPATIHVKVGKYVHGSSVDICNYRSMIGSLLYLTARRLDITLCRCVCQISSRSKGKPSESSEENHQSTMSGKVLSLYCDNLSAINISKKPVQHSQTKHIDIRYHFISELVEDKVISLEHVRTYKQLADIITKALDSIRFESFRSSLGLCVIDK